MVITEDELIADVSGPVLDCAAVRAQDAIGGWSVVVGGVMLPVRYSDRWEAAEVARRLWSMLSEGHDTMFAMHLHSLAPVDVGS